MRQVVAFTANNRPHYMRETLESWSQVRGIEDTHLIFRVEPGNPEVEKICEGAADFSRLTEVHTNPVQYGPLDNPFHCFETGFSLGHQFVILAEDDSLVSDDVLEYFLWAELALSNRPDVLAVCAFRHEEAPCNDDHGVSYAPFRPTIWGTWRDRWEKYLRDDWDHDYRHKGWDWRISEYWLAEQGFQVVAPCRSRSQVSGEHGGTHLQPGAQYRAHLSTCWSPHYERGYFYEEQQ